MRKEFLALILTMVMIVAVFAFFSVVAAVLGFALASMIAAVTSVKFSLALWAGCSALAWLVMAWAGY